MKEEKSTPETQRSELAQLLKSMKRQENFARRALWHQRIRTGLAVIVVAVVVALAGTASATLHDVQLLASNASYAVNDLHRTVQDLKLQESLDGIDALVREGSNMIDASAEDIESSLRAIASLDVQGLNESIRALEAVATSIGRFFGYQGE